MQQSLRDAAQLTLVREVDAGPLIAARKAFQAGAGSSIDRIPYDVLLARALARALLAHPALNAAVEGDQIVVYEEAHVGVAVALPNDGGLVVPVLRHPAQRPVPDLARELDDLASRAREHRLRTEELEGATATLTNLGSYGVDSFTPILDPPQSVILGVGRIAPRPFAGEDGALGVRPTVHLCLTFDHRVADGATAARLLDVVVTELAALPE
jgi:pyruvate/2-oxoglutarate dehydrogenase complex dihydrolipoamide acyltransferase (E2) component